MSYRMKNGVVIKRDEHARPSAADLNMSFNDNSDWFSRHHSLCFISQKRNKIVLLPYFMYLTTDILGSRGHLR